jgi:hypothetical protein
LEHGSRNHGRGAADLMVKICLSELCPHLYIIWGGGITTKYPYTYFTLPVHPSHYESPELIITGMQKRKFKNSFMKANLEIL